MFYLLNNQKKSTEFIPNYGFNYLNEYWKRQGYLPESILYKYLHKCTKMDGQGDSMQLCL